MRLIVPTTASSMRISLRWFTSPIPRSWASDQYGTADNLIEFVKSAEGNFTYVEGDVMPPVTDDQGNTLGITFTVDAVTEEYVTITFTAA